MVATPGKSQRNYTLRLLSLGPFIASFYHNLQVVHFSYCDIKYIKAGTYNGKCRLCHSSWDAGQK